MAIESILIVDDEPLITDFLKIFLTKKNFAVSCADNGKKALFQLREKHFDLVITDMKMPDMTGIELLTKIKEHSPSTLVIVLTAFGSVENAVEAMQLGAFHYMIKPFSPDAIEALIHKASQHTNLLRENQYLKQQNASHASSIIAESSAMKKILQEVKQIAKTDATVFISGESGTGKEVIAEAIHKESKRTNNPYIKVNCAAIPDTLVEAEFFGHEKGAFTGAINKRIGRFELANFGTLLLDEITEIPLALQAKLLRVLQEQEFERVGGVKPINVDVRLISTSNRDIQKAISSHQFREDLFYRLNVIPIILPALRDRKEDIIPLSRFFVEKFSSKNSKDLKILSNQAEKKLIDYSWPGNVRELSNIIERAVIISSSNTIQEEEILISSQALQDVELPIGLSLKELEKRFIIETLAKNQNDAKKTAAILGITPRVLKSKLDKL